jgi:hypothetical protein
LSPSNLFIIIPMSNYNRNKKYWEIHFEMAVINLLTLLYSKNALFLIYFNLYTLLLLVWIWSVTMSMSCQNNFPSPTQPLPQVPLGYDFQFFQSPLATWGKRWVETGKMKKTGTGMGIGNWTGREFPREFLGIPVNGNIPVNFFGNPGGNREFFF